MAIAPRLGLVMKVLSQALILYRMEQEVHLFMYSAKTLLEDPALLILLTLIFNIGTTQRCLAQPFYRDLIRRLLTLPMGVT